MPPGEPTASGSTRLRATTPKGVASTARLRPLCISAAGCYLVLGSCARRACLYILYISPHGAVERRQQPTHVANACGGGGVTAAVNLPAWLQRTCATLRAARPQENNAPSQGNVTHPCSLAVRLLLVRQSVRCRWRCGPGGEIQTGTARPRPRLLAAAVSKPLRQAEADHVALSAPSVVIVLEARPYDRTPPAVQFGFWMGHDRTTGASGPGVPRPGLGS